MVIVVPGTSTIRGIPLHVVLSPDPNNGLSTETAFQAEKVRAASTAASSSGSDGSIRWAASRSTTPYATYSASNG